MIRIQFIRRPEFDRIRSAKLDTNTQLALLAAMCRANTLAAVKRAGSGHLGSSFSAMDIVAWLYHRYLNVTTVGISSPDRDVYFSSKGHDVPGLYSVLYSLGIVDEERFLKLRRYGGLDGHPDVGIPGIEANSGSLGMGTSKGKGMLWAKRFLGRKGRVVVMLGDGELQEGQNFEAFQAAAHQRIPVTVIVDHNKLQSDKQLDEIVSLGDLDAKFRAFGWHVQRIDGHDFEQLDRAFRTADEQAGPRVIIADTIKGRGVSFMEHPEALRANNGKYRWHAGAPDDASFVGAYTEIRKRLDEHLAELKLAPIQSHEIQEDGSFVAAVPGDVALGEDGVVPPRLAATAEYVAQAYGDTLFELAKEVPNLVVLDGDLAVDCRVRKFEETYPERFIEDGISEQDMVSMAGGLARHGMIPVVNSFASFLCSRANEQIYNNATERSKVIYAAHYAGLIPAGPGKSHQSIRDISLLGALPNVVIVQPVNSVEARQLTEWAVREAKENVAMRLVIGPCPRPLALADDYKVSEGRGVIVHEGRDAVVFAYGPVMVNEALIAAEQLANSGFSLRVINMPWLNRTNREWLAEAIKGFTTVCVVEDHSPVGGLGDQLRRVLETRKVDVFGVEGFPACGNPVEALRAHRLDGASLAERILGASKVTS